MCSDPEQSRLRVWDLGGRKDLRRLWSHYYAEAHAVVFVVNLKQLPQRLAELYGCFGTRKENAEQLLREDNLQDIPFLVVLNDEARANEAARKDLTDILGNLLKGRIYRLTDMQLPTGEYD